jgi:hypothetical protein
MTLADRSGLGLAATIRVWMLLTALIIGGC